MDAVTLELARLIIDHLDSFDEDQVREPRRFDLEQIAHTIDPSSEETLAPSKQCACNDERGDSRYSSHKSDLPVIPAPSTPETAAVI